MEVQIVPPSSENHFEFIAKSFEETIALWESYEVTETSLAKRREMVEKWHRDEKTHLSVALDSRGEVLGFNSLYLTKDYREDWIGKIVILYVVPEHRRKGVARKLKEEGEKWLRSQGAKKVITEIDAQNDRMVEINKKAGFKIGSYIMEKKI